MSFEVGFIDGPRGPLFRCFHPASGRSRGRVLFVPPFGEEHNKSRRMVAEQARAFAAAGFDVLQPDLFGCGDSAGEFGEADWAGWRDDLSACLAWLDDSSSGPLVLWGLRAGALLLSDWLVHASMASNAIAPPVCTVLWQPVSHGDTYLNQFLRLRVAAGMMGGNKESTRQLRERLAAGEPLEVAGYTLSPGVAQGLAQARLVPPPSGAVLWLEVANAESAELPPASRKRVDEWCGAGLIVRSAVVSGEPFWSTQEIGYAPELITTTLCLLDEVLA